MIRYLLDTDVASDVIRGVSAQVDARLAAAAPGELAISAVTRGELLFGVRLKVGAHRLERLVEEFLDRMVCLPWDADAADRFAAIAADLQRAGKPIGALDTMIAAHALAQQAILVTSNERHFSRVRGLSCENWRRRG